MTSPTAGLDPHQIAALVAVLALAGPAPVPGVVVPARTGWAAPLGASPVSWANRPRPTSERSPQ